MVKLPLTRGKTNVNINFCGDFKWQIFAGLYRFFAIYKFHILIGSYSNCLRVDFFATLALLRDYVRLV